MSARCLRMAASATLARRPTSSSPSSPPPNSTSGRFCPLCPTGYGNSPYAGSSAFAGNPYLISLEFLADWGWIDGDRIADLAGTRRQRRFRPGRSSASSPCSTKRPATFSIAAPHDAKLAAAVEAVSRSSASAQSAWLADYALYAVLRREFNTGAWTAWPEPLRSRDPQALAEVAATSRPRPRPGAGPAVRLLAAVEQLLREAAAAQRHPHPRRRGHLRQHGLGRRLGASRALRTRRGSQAHPHRRRAARLLLAHRPALGQSALSLGRRCSRPASTGGSTASAAPASSTTSSASTTSAALKPTGPFPPKKRPPSTASGSRLPASSSFTRSRPHWGRCRWSLKTSASSLLKLKPCASSSGCPA